MRPPPQLHLYQPNVPWKQQTIHELSFQGQQFEFPPSKRILPVVSIAYGIQTYCTHNNGSSYLFTAAEEEEMERTFNTVHDYTHFAVAFIDKRHGELLPYGKIRDLLRETPFTERPEAKDMSSCLWDEEICLAQISTESIDVLLQAMYQISQEE